MISYFNVDELIVFALKEDMPLGDITTDNLININATAKARFIVKEAGVIAGLDVAERVFKLLDDKISFIRRVNEGDVVKPGDIIVDIEGNSRAMLKGERTALNFVQRLSGVATTTRKYAEKVKDYPVKVVDTRKTTPGLRFLEKYAVKVGGGENHRLCLSDGVLIKDNHIKAAGSIKNAVMLAKKGIPHTIKIEVETETLEQVKEALEAGADIIMLDNMDYATMTEAVKIINKKATVEASGNADLEKLIDIAKTGVDIISVGKLTHSISALDISMRFL